MTPRTLRFAKSDPRADSIAALSLVRALAYHLIETGQLSTAELEKIRTEALEELATGSGPAIEEARAMIEQEFP